MFDVVLLTLFEVCFTDRNLCIAGFWGFLCFFLVPLLYGIDYNYGYTSCGALAIKADSSESAFHR